MIDFKQKSGITLIALVITIIVLLILAGVAISMLTGDNGILTIAATSKEETEEAAVQEAINLAYMNALTQYYEDGTSIVETMQEELESQYREGNVTIAETDGTYTVTIDGIAYTLEGTIDTGTASKVDTNSTNVEIISTEESYIGYYADVNGDGTVDGIIYADLAFSASGTGLSYSYSYDAVSASVLKEYYIKETSYTDTYFGTADVISPVSGTSGEDRFYVMALTDSTTSSYSTFYWYYNAYSNTISDYSTVTSPAFGSGKTNTVTMQALWNSEIYGSKNSRDMWALEVVGSDLGDSIWFIPSIKELEAFIGNMCITIYNFSNYGLSSVILTSSLNSETSPYYAYLSTENLSTADAYQPAVINVTLKSDHSVRLSATF